jgi:hypothetical protein
MYHVNLPDASLRASCRPRKNSFST